MLIELDSKLVAQEPLYLASILQTSNWEKVDGLSLSPLSYVCHNLKTKSNNIKLPFFLQTRANLLPNIFCKLLFVFWMGEKFFQLYLIVGSFEVCMASHVINNLKCHNVQMGDAGNLKLGFSLFTNCEQQKF